jgi:hypothetical protein
MQRKLLAFVDEYRSEWERCLMGDPVRPHIPAYDRTGVNRGYYLLHVGHRVLGVTCVSFIDAIPAVEEDLFADCDSFNVACFYSVWSNERGAGREVLNRSLAHIKVMKPWVKYACTLSPKTDMAKKFHISNGAWLHRENETTDNYCYKLER